MDYSNRPYAKGFFEVFKPTPILTVSEWAEKYRILTSEGSSMPGKYRNEITPYWVEVMNALSPSSPTREVAIMKSVQCGATDAMFNWVLYHMHIKPGPFLYMMPTDDLVKKISKQRLSPAINKISEIRCKLSKKLGNSLTNKVYNGGFLSLSGATSSNAFSTCPFGYLIMDEMDRFEINVGDEGDPVKLARNRMITFQNWKAAYISTPKLKETSTIYKLYQDSDQGVYKVPCPDCSGVKGVTDDGFFEMKEELLIWTKGDYDDVFMQCPHCGSLIPESEKNKIVAKGKWVAKNPGHERRGFHVTSFMSYFVKWSDIAKEKDKIKNSPEAEQVYINQTLGLPYEEKGELMTIDYCERMEKYNAEVPNTVFIITLSVDVQKDRLEYEVKGWGKDKESWGIEYGKLYGHTYEITESNKEFPSVWSKLDEVRNRRFTREDGIVLKIMAVGIDSGGNEGITDTVYSYCKKWSSKNVIALKGSSQSKDVIYTPPAWKKGGYWFGRVGTFEAKRLIYHLLKKNDTGAGYLHFPFNTESGYDETAMKTLTAERLVFEYRNGYKKLKWVKEKHVRNELLDLNVYNFWLIEYVIHRFGIKWDVLERRYNGNTVHSQKNTQIRSNHSNSRKLVINL